MQVDFFATWNDSWMVLEALLNDGFSLIPDKNYSVDAVEIWNELDSNRKDQIKIRRSIVLWNENLPIPVLNKIDFNRHCIQYASGTPLLRLIVAPCFFEAQMMVLGTGTLSTTARSLASEQPLNLVKVEDAFKKAKVILSKQMSRIGRGLLIGTEANRLRNENNARLDGLCDK